MVRMHEQGAPARLWQRVDREEEVLMSQLGAPTSTSCATTAGTRMSILPGAPVFKGCWSI